jgi:hypothetical protein
MSYDSIVNFTNAVVTYSVVFYTLKQLPDVITDIILCGVLYYVVISFV